MRLEIAGDDFTSYALRGSLNVAEVVNQRNTMNVDLKADSGQFRPEPGASVAVYDDDDNLIFGGTVDEEEEEAFFTGDDSLKQSLPCVDYNQLADRFLVVETYENQTLGFIVNDIMTKYLAADGVTAGTIQTGPTITKAVFPYMTVAKCFEELAQLSGFTWSIGYDKTLSFADPSTFAAPWNITATSPIRGVKVRNHREAYRNRQYLRAGKDIAAAVTRSFKGDGVNKVFTVDLPVAKVPTVTVNGSGKTVGIKGLDTGKDWYWNKGEKEITQDDAGTAMATTDTLAVTYQGYYPIVVINEATGEIDDMAAREGGSGVYEALDTAATIDTKDSALQYVDGLLRKYGHLGQKVQFVTNQPGLKAGQTITIDLPVHGISAKTFYLSRVSIRDVGAGSLEYRVEALDGEGVGGWEKFFKKLVEDKQEYVIRENEVIVKLYSMTDYFHKLTMTDAAIYTLHTYLLANTTQKCGAGVII